MKLRSTKNLLLSLMVIIFLMLASVTLAEDDGSRDKRGIPAATWSTSWDRLSSVSSRNGPGLPGQWSPSYNPDAGASKNSTDNIQVDSLVQSSKIHVDTDLNSNKRVYSGHGIPYGTWSTSRDETSSASTRLAPGSVGQWSPYASPPDYEDSLATHHTTPRDLQETSTTFHSASGTRKATGAIHQNSGPTNPSTKTTSHAVLPAQSSVVAKGDTTHGSTTRVQGQTTFHGKTSADTASPTSKQVTRVGGSPVSSAAKVDATSSAIRPGVVEGYHTSVVGPVAGHVSIAEPALHYASVAEPVSFQAPIVEEVLPAHYRSPMSYERPAILFEHEEIVGTPMRIERPYILEETAIFEDVVVEHESPVIEYQRELPTTESQKFINEYNKNKYPGLIFGVDEEIEIEKCFHQAIDFYQNAQVEEVYEDGIIQTPFGSTHVRSPSYSHVNRPARQHEEVLEKCVHKTIIAPTTENGVRIPQVRYLNLTQIKTGTFEWPVVRKAQVLPRKTLEKTVTIPQVGFVDLCQDHPTTEHSVMIPQVHTVLVEQIVHTDECEVNIPQVHKIWIPIMGDVTVDQYPTKTRRVSLKQEWDCTIRCEDTRVHFIKIPQRDEGVTGTVIKNPYDEGKNICHNCHSSKCAGVGPSLNPFLIQEHRDVTPAPVIVQAVAPAPEPEVRVETKYVEVIKEVPIPCPEPEPQVIVAPAPAPVQAAVQAPPPEPEVKVVTETVYVEVPAPAAEPQVIIQKQDPTEIHHIKLGQCPCSETVIANPVSFAEGAPGAPIQFLQGGAAAASSGFPWWLIPLLLFLPLLLAMLLAWLLCRGRNRKEIVAAAPVEQESPKKKFVIEMRNQAKDRQSSAHAFGEERKAEATYNVQAKQESHAIQEVHAAQEARAVMGANTAKEARAGQDGSLVQETKIIKETTKIVKEAQSAHERAGGAGAVVIEKEGAGATGVEEGKAASAGSPGTKVKQQRLESPGSSRRSSGRNRSSRGSGSSKKVVKKRIVKMMKQGKLVAEKEEILDAEGNVIRTEIRKQGFTSESPGKSNE
ncbi:unnamed protein product [Moneuplotes crassus]|uniref:Uncharacterized protein n=2 Tax=Euplotes crassus TaxID=5936 RepID=A0AAD2D3D3_EUPCR|nr:unnamed protein product [Moneuplotes crassus]